MISYAHYYKSIKVFLSYYLCLQVISMKPPCELIVGKVLPSIRAAIVKVLIDEFNLKQTEISDILGISQSAVSQYYTSARAADERFIELFPEITKYAHKVAGEIINGKIDGSQISLCIPCQNIRAEKEFKNVQNEFLQLKECQICEPLVKQNSKKGKSEEKMKD